MRLIHLYLFSVSFVIGSCTKKEKPEPISTIPKIISIDIAPNRMKAFQDSLTFKIRYQEGDGDLGSSKQEIDNLFIQDNRLPSSQVHKFRIAQLAPDNSNAPIQGNLNVVLRNILLTDSVASQDASFTVWMKDRSDKESNRFQTSKITVIR